MGFDAVTYDAKADAVYVRFNTEKVSRTSVVDHLRMIDYSSDGAVIGIEFLEVSGGIDLRELPFSKRVEQLLGESGHHFKIFA